MRRRGCHAGVVTFIHSPIVATLLCWWWGFSGTLAVLGVKSGIPVRFFVLGAESSSSGYGFCRLPRVMGGIRFSRLYFYTSGQTSWLCCCYGDVFFSSQIELGLPPRPVGTSKQSVCLTRRLVGYARNWRSMKLCPAGHCALIVPALKC